MPKSSLLPGDLNKQTTETKEPPFPVSAWQNRGYAHHKALTEAQYLVSRQSWPSVRDFICFLRGWFLWSTCNPLCLPTTSPTRKSPLHPILKYIILLIQICQGFYCICISNLIKSFSGWQFSLKATSNWIFFPCSLSPSPVQLHIQIANHSISREQQWSAVAIFSSLACRVSALHCQLRALLTEHILQAP